MSYLVTARKWRPMVFEHVVGQSHVATTLRNAIATNRLSHAYIFSGPRGVGKTTTARILAKAINCKSPRDFNPDNECEICREITEGRSIDVLEIDGASNRGVDEIRNLRESVRYPPARGKYKVYIIDEVHMLTKEAFNALLKTLEEPPPHIVFVFATTEVHKVPPTILSRCQRFDFRRISVDEIIERLHHIAGQENITVQRDALLIIAKKADGSLRDAQSIFDQVVSFCGNNIDSQQIMNALNVVDEELYFRVTDLIRAKDRKGGLALVEEVISRGYDIKEFLDGLNEHFRNILVVLTTSSTKLVETSEVLKKRYEEVARHLSEEDVIRLTRTVSDVVAALRWTDQPRFKLEVGLLQMIKMDNSVDIGKLLQELEDLKKRIDHPDVKGEQSTLPRPDAPPDRAKLKVTGSVKASPPTMGKSLLPDQTWSHQATPLHQKDSTASIGEWSNAQPAGQHFVVGTHYTPSGISPPSIGEGILAFPGEAAVEKWDAVVENATKHRIVVGTMLKESHFAGIVEGALRVRCPDDVHLSMVHRNREFLAQLVHQIYGAGIYLEATVAPDHEHQPSDHTDHPVIAALKREFGAEPIE